MSSMLETAKEKLTEGYDVVKEKLTGDHISEKAKDECPMFTHTQKTDSTGKLIQKPKMLQRADVQLIFNFN
uniref:Uncharacterized protein n=1 Tax=Ditylenchus dipsaci TaxID=166011 RepID=A0A915EDL0_9BILA